MLFAAAIECLRRHRLYVSFAHSHASPPEQLFVNRTVVRPRANRLENARSRPVPTLINGRYAAYTVEKAKGLFILFFAHAVPLWISGSNRISANGHALHSLWPLTKLKWVLPTNRERIDGVLHCTKHAGFSSAIVACLASIPWHPLATLVRSTHHQKSFLYAPNKGRALNTQDGDAQD